MSGSIDGQKPLPPSLPPSNTIDPSQRPNSVIGRVEKRAVGSFRVGAASAVLRLLSLLGRFALAMYIAHQMGLEAFASFSFVVGASAVLVAAGGLGMTFTINRLLVGEQSMVAFRILRDRMFVRVVATIALISAGLVGNAIRPFVEPQSVPLIATILVGEVLLFDIKSMMISRSRPVLANGLLFVHTSAWIPPVIVLSEIWPHLATLQLVYFAWAVGVAVSIIAVLISGLRFNILKISFMEFDFSWMSKRYTKTVAVYFAEMGTIATIYFDRYCVGDVVGVAAAGKFAFIWTFTNSIVSLVQASQLQQSFPRLVKLWAAKQTVIWGVTVTNYVNSILWNASLMGLSVWIAIIAIFPYLGISSISGVEGLTILMIIATVIRLVGDMLQQAIYSARSDLDWIAINTISLFVSPFVTFISISMFGLEGAGIQMVINSTVLLISRYSSYSIILNNSLERNHRATEFRQRLSQISLEARESDSPVGQPVSGRNFRSRS